MQSKPTDVTNETHSLPLSKPTEDENSFSMKSEIQNTIQHLFANRENTKRHSSVQSHLQICQNVFPSEYI